MNRPTLCAARLVLLLGLVSAAAQAAAPATAGAPKPAAAAPAATAPATATPPKPAPVPDGWPATPAGGIARQWVNAFGAGDDSMAACLTRLLPPESLVKRPMAERLTTYHRLRDEFGTLALFNVEKQSATEIVATLVAADMSKHSFTFTVQDTSPARLLTVKTTMGGHHIPGLGWLHH